MNRANINIYLALICFRIRQLFPKVAHQWRLESAELIHHLEILGDKISRLLLLNHDTKVCKR